MPSDKSGVRRELPPRFDFTHGANENGLQKRKKVL